MKDRAASDAHGVLIEPMSLQIQRLLPGPIERVWSYITDGELRRTWLAARRWNCGLARPSPSLGATTG